MVFGIGKKPTQSVVQNSLVPSAQVQTKSVSEQELRQAHAAAKALNQRADEHEAASLIHAQNAEILKTKAANLQVQSNKIQKEIDGCQKDLVKIDNAREKALALKAARQSGQNGVKTN